MPQQSTVVTHEAGSGYLYIDLGNKMINLEGADEPIIFQRGDSDAPDAMALWLDHGQAGTLIKMIDYILQKVQISPGAFAILGQLLPDLQAIVARLEASRDDLDGDSA